jgi:hypothetical protein
MKLPSHPLLLLISTFSGFVNAAGDDYDVAIRQVMNANGIIGSAVAFYDGVSECELYSGLTPYVTHPQRPLHCIVGSGQRRKLCSGVWQNLW